MHDGLVDEIVRGQTALDRAVAQRWTPPRRVTAERFDRATARWLTP
jgi:hypothetical protein